MRSQSSKANELRSKSGSIMPMVAFALVFVFAFLAFVMDVMREILEIQQMKHAATVAALDALPFACLDVNGMAQNSAVCNADGSFVSQAMNQMQVELQRTNGSANGVTWNSAISNLESGQSWLKGVRLDPADLAAAAQNNSSDKKDPVLQLTVRRAGSDAMNFFFLPVRFVASTLGGASAIPVEAQQTAIVQTIEVAGQPATRIGPGPALDSSSGRAQIIAAGRFATFPLAINYDDFKRALAAAGSSQSINLRVCDPNSAQLPNTSDLRAYFINLKSGGAVSSYYFDAQNPTRVNDLIGLLEYFSNPANVPEPIVTPGAVERGVQIDRFSQAAIKGNQDLAAVIGQLPSKRAYIVPVVREISNQCEVIGFAFLKLSGASSSNGNWTFSFSIGESLPVLNASAAPALKSIPRFDGSPLPAVYDSANNPFMPRKYDPASNTLSPRQPGLVLAPAVSPRRIFTQS